MAEKLNQRQSLFVAAYLSHGNATQAAIDAGYAAANADVTGPRMLENVGVRAAIDEAQAKVLAKAEVTVERVVQELASIAFSDLRDVATWNEDALALIDSAALTDDAARALREVVAVTTVTDSGERSTTTTRLQVRQHDKIAALRLLAQYLGMLKDESKVELGPLEVRLSFDPRGDE